MPRRWNITLGILLIGGALVGMLLTRRSSAPEEHAVRVERRDIVQEVGVSGRVRARKSVALSFEGGGTVTSVPVAVGDSVHRGQLLIAVDARAQSLEVASAEASLASARLSTAIAFQSAQERLDDTLAANASNLEAKRQAVRNAKVELDQAEAVRQQEITDGGDRSVKAGSALLTVRKAESAHRAAQKTLVQALAEAAQAEHAARAELRAADADRAAVDQAARAVPGLSVLKAALEAAEVRREKTALTSPIAGTVTDLHVDAGEFASPGVPVVTVETADDLELVADVAETDIAKLRTGQEASVRFDALRDAEPSRAVLARIDPSATVIEGVPTFRATWSLAHPSEHVRPGMTADISIRTAERASVLAVPQRALGATEGGSLVRVLGADGRTEEERAVSLGLRGADGFVEVTDGLREGEQIVIPRPDARTRGRL